MENPLCYKCMAGEECSLGGVPCTLVMWNRVEELIRRIDMWDWKRIMTAVRRIGEARRHLKDENSKTWVNFIKRYDARQKAIARRLRAEQAKKKKEEAALHKKVNGGSPIRKTTKKGKHGTLFLKAMRHAQSVLKKRN
uniref:Reverse transcriptase domain-containing protein n=1 Tax=Syphacia muris TaxID=451379 RepID=A0A0N5AGC5_9BILA